MIHEEKHLIACFTMKRAILEAIYVLHCPLFKAPFCNTRCLAVGIVESKYTL
jgi:hypothetical protein